MSKIVIDPITRIEGHLKIEAIVEAIRNNEEPPVTGQESLKSLAIVEAVYKSSKTGVPVKMSDLLKKENSKIIK